MPRTFGEFWKELGKDVRGGLFFLLFPLLLVAIALYGIWLLRKEGGIDFKGVVGSLMLGILGILCYVPWILIINGEDPIPTLQALIITTPIYFFAAITSRELLLCAEDQAKHEEEMERGTP